MWLAVFGLPDHEKQSENTHVESTLVPRLDEGSSPSNSTIKGSENRRMLIYPAVFYCSHLSVY